MHSVCLLWPSDSEIMVYSSCSLIKYNYFATQTITIISLFLHALCSAHMLCLLLIYDLIKNELSPAGLISILSIKEI